MVEDRTQVTVTNHPKTQNLEITKHLTADSAPLVEGENPVFEFRVYLETTVTNEDGTTQQQLVPYSYGPYYLVKEVDGAIHYFTLTGVNNAPVDKGTTKTVCSTTGRSGSINSIPPEYTIIIPYTNRTFPTWEQTEIIIDPVGRKVGWNYTGDGEKKNRRWKYPAMRNSLYKELKEIDAESAKKEETRILYVAMTRAIHNLICIVPDSKNESTWAHLIEEVGVDYE